MLDAAEHGSAATAGLNLRRMIGESLSVSRRTRRARRAVAGQAAGRDVEDVRDLISRKWAEHRLEPLDPVGRDRLLDEIQHPPGLLERAERKARWLRDLLGLPWRLKRAGARVATNVSTERLIGGGTYRIATSKEMVEVPLEAESALVHRITNQAVLAPSLLRITSVELRRGPGGLLEIWGAPNGPDQFRLGVLPDTEVSAFAYHVEAATRVGQACQVPACFVRSRAGAWKLLVGRPLAPNET